MFSVKPSDVAEAIIAALLFVAIVGFWYMQLIATQLFFHLSHFGIWDIAFYVSVTAVVLVTMLALARSIARLLPNTAGRVVFNFKKKKD